MPAASIKKHKLNSDTAPTFFIKKGKSRLEISEALGVHIKTVDRWRADFKRHGTAAILPKKRGRQEGTDRSLTPEQEVEVQKKIIEKTPD